MASMNCFLPNKAIHDNAHWSNSFNVDNVIADLKQYLSYVCYNLLLFVAEDEHSKELPKVSVKFFLHSSGNIAAKFPYDPVILLLLCSFFFFFFITYLTLIMLLIYVLPYFILLRW